MRAAQLVAYEKDFQVNQVADPTVTDPLDVICGTYNELAELLALARRGAVTLETTTFGLDGINEALHALDDGRLLGRGVLVPNES